MTRTPLALVALLGASALVLAGCSSTPGGATGGNGDGKIQVVASTSVYGDIVEAIAGDAVDVTSIVASTSQDPHSYEASAADQLTVSQADLIIENGGGYDAFIDGLIEATGSSAHVITAAEFSHDWPGNEGHDHADGDDHDHADETDAADDHDHGDHEGHDHIEGFNEHVWYDPHTMEHLAEAIAEELTELAPADADAFQKGLSTFVAGIGDLETSLADISAAHEGDKIFVTEPVPLYLTAAAGLTNVTPEAFSEAVEEGQDVPPATLLEADKLLKAGDVRAVIANAQTGGAETTQVIETAKAAGIPVIEFTEILPEGKTYLTWMADNISTLAATLNR
ncbi:metal ABC transporter solute-binding protein, Zn/Mn family [Microbacterium sp. TNHR37B]|uniref:metal ABC transporter solute-binding protein, Zn/Mn family n=1 Tax=Microbacterium sp. TNHR37B TaxID=1775956 RepID=UPI0007B300B5|nr:zinc ABC transporter substrate-binding protein [Microbacterium sp. TNHR37B]KZE89980.1 Manganese ABC transporter substrate-binding lipoprotein [Microbacterium sp. TNHR37B]